MKLRYSATSPFVRKIMVQAHEGGFADLLELVETNVWAPDVDIATVNPLGKVPALVLDDGSVMVDSPVICEYLDSEYGGNKLIPVSGPERWKVLRLQAFADGITDAVLLNYLERKRPDNRQSAGWIARQTRAVAHSLNLLENEAPSFGEAVDIGQIGLACAFGYMDFRFPDDGWRDNRPDLAAWYEEFAARPSMRATAPPPPA
jgi:glutathione S-transferase